MRQLNPHWEPCAQPSQINPRKWRLAAEHPLDLTRALQALALMTFLQEVHRIVSRLLYLQRSDGLCPLPICRRIRGVRLSPISSHNVAAPVGVTPWMWPRLATMVPMTPPLMVGATILPTAIFGRTPEIMAVAHQEQPSKIRFERKVA